MKAGEGWSYRKVTWDGMENNPECEFMSWQKPSTVKCEKCGSYTIKFCDYYGFEYASIKKNIKVPLLKIETDFTSQSAGQLLTRIQAFAETIEGSEDMDPGKGISEEARKKMESGIYYVAGIDSGSTSTDVVILDQDGKIKSTMIIPTGGGAMMSAEKSLDLAIEKAGIKKED